MKIRWLFIGICIFAAGCSAKPESTIEKFVGNVADGDVRRANNLIDRQSINSDLIKQEVHESGLDHNFMKMNVGKIIQQANDRVKQRVWKAFDDEVNKGRCSVFAGMEILREHIGNNNDASVVVQFDNGKETTLRLSKENGKWVITGLDLGIFNKIVAHPSFRRDKIGLLEKYAGKYQDDKFQALIMPELLNLVGDDYYTLINNTSVSGCIRKVGRYIVLDGNAPLSGGSDEGIIVIDVKTGILSAAIMKGRKVFRFSDIKSVEEYPDLIKSWNKES